MFNSRWQMNRIGLLDFWYYDEEEFRFLDGRMLLRGANGSGKSVTMQSFIPLLLDGNLRPERLDPFGSRARKMENYLLEEGDEREERIGYLYMEFKRLEGDNYLTIGIGLRARKNKKLETWYFYINDNRRIGKDLHLYKETGGRLAYTKQELKNRIGEGGRVLDSQTEYMECVNRLIFGFDTMDQYKEMLELLIQLRTPKLSKDFKPTVINEILSGSLQTLSEEDLLPMSEAIENMDALKTNLDALRDSIQAAGQIGKVYDGYNRIVLYDKASGCIKDKRLLKECEQRAEELKEGILCCGTGIREEEERYERLRQEETVLEQEKRSLDQSDAARLKEQEVSLRAEIEGGREQVQKKEEQREEKRQRQTELSRAAREQAGKNETKWEETKALLDEMEELLKDIPFDEAAFMKKELLEKGEEEYDFRSHEELLAAYRHKIEEGIEVLNKERISRERYDEQIKQADALRKERDQAERETVRYQGQLQEIKNELVEAVFLWEKANRELKLETGRIQGITRQIEEFDEHGDYSAIKEAVREEYHVREDSLRRELTELRSLVKKAQDLEQEKLTELTEWVEKREAEPEVTEAVKKNRELLRSRGIPYQQFYKAVDFEASLGREQAARLEEALSDMGLLDALIVPAEYRSQIQKLDKGVCDRYIFSDAAHVKKNLSELLEVDNPGDDIIFYQNISNILRSIGYMEGEPQEGTWIDGGGNYRLGILEGTVTGEYEARFIGARAREAYQRKMIEELQADYEALKKEREDLEEQAGQIEKRLERLKEEQESFPDGVDLKMAAMDYGNSLAILDRLKQQLTALQEKLYEAEAALAQIRLQMQEICGRAYLPARMDVFIQAKRDLEEYTNYLYQVRLAHSSYLNGISSLSGIREQEGEVEADLDTILYDLGRMSRDLEGKQRTLESVLQQLALTDYEQMKERLDYCMGRLRAIPGEREAAVAKKAALLEKKEAMGKEQAANEEARSRAAVRADYSRTAFEKELALGYVDHGLPDGSDTEEQARRLVKMLEGTFGNKRQNDFFNAVQEAYHQNRGYLLEYNLTMDRLFTEEEARPGDAPSPGRIDITAKYRGTKVKFKVLAERLKQDMEEQTALLNEKDRELFEDILANTISKKIRARIHASNLWVEEMNSLMGSMQTSSGLTLSLKWRSRRAEQEEQLDTRELVSLLQKDAEIMREDEVEKLSRHFRSKIEEARKTSDDSGNARSFHAVMRDVLDYRKWFEFQLEYRKAGEAKKELTDRAFFTFSGGEKAMSMYVPLFSAVAAKYAAARPDAPRIISLDEAFAGVDEMNIKDMFRLMVKFDFNFIINSQILWGDYETVPAIAVYQLVRPENAKYVTVIAYVWNGRSRSLANESGDRNEQ